MPLTNTEQVMPAKLAQASANPLFPALDSALRAGCYIGLDELNNHAFLMDFQDYLEEFYIRYNIESTRAPEGFFYPRPRPTTLISRLVLLGLDVMVGKALCYLHLGPECLANEGIFIQQELYGELLTLADESKPLKLANNRSTGSGLDRQKLQEKMRASLNRLCRPGVVWFMGHDSSKSHITESVFRSGVDARVSDDLREAQRRLIRDGEAMALENHLQLNDENEENQPDSGEEE